MHLDIGNGVSPEKVDKFCYLGEFTSELLHDSGMFVLNRGAQFPEHNIVHLNLTLSTPLLKGTGIRGLMRGMATLLQNNQEILVVRDKV